MKKRSKLNIKKIIKNIIIGLYDITVITTVLASIIYLLGWIVLALVDYADIHPIRTALGCGAWGVVMMAIDTIQDKQKAHKRTQKGGCKYAR